MKQFLHLIMAILLLSVAGCSGYDDTDLVNRMGNLEERVSALEDLCKEMNTNISSLQSIVKALQQNDYIADVTPITEGGATIGYKIAFAYGDPIEIYHGKDGEDGKDGKDGQDGQVPIIGVKQDSAGRYYWTLNGEWLLDNKGNKVPTTGQDGQDGEPGKDGDDGIIPQLKIEEGYWYISYDNGLTYSILGKAIGEDGKNGDSFFQSVDASESDYVIFTLADGTQIKFPTWYAFEQLQKECNQMNTNIVALQTIVSAIQKMDYVEGISPLIENGEEVGYTITFTQSGTIAIYHGKSGVDGIDAEKPVIGVKVDVNGVYCWTINGDWLLDENGNKVKATGVDGENGKAGEDGITPQLKIEDGYWYISYNNGKTWEQLGKATGENGANGENGKDGDSFFANITQDEINVYFELVDGTTIILPKRTSILITFNEGDLSGMYTNSTRYIGYSITSIVKPVTVEVVSSADIKARIIAEDESGLTGEIEVKTSDSIDEYSKIVVLVSNGENIIMRSIAIEEAGLIVENNTEYNISSDGGEIALNFLSNVACEVVIPQSAQSWISVTPSTHALNQQTIRLNIERNLGYGRRAAVIVQSIDGHLSLNYTISQQSDPTLFPANNEIWYTSSDGKIVTPNMVDAFGATLVSNTYDNGKGILRFDGDVAKIEKPSSGKIAEGSQAVITKVEGPFSGCYTLESITLPNSLTLIGERAFYDCRNLKVITIPESVETIAPLAFTRCYGLKEFKGKFAADNGRCLIKNGMIIAYADGSGSEYNIPSEVTSIGESAFYETAVRDITVPSGTTIIESSAFMQCSSLRTIDIPESVDTIKMQAFSGCIRLEEIVIPSKVTAIEDKTFYNCESFTQIVIPESITSIGTSAFYGCKKVASVVIPKSVTRIGQGAFGNCSTLNEITIYEGITSVSPYTFQNCTSLTKITLPKSVTAIEEYAFRYCSSLTAIELPQTLNSIGECAFDSSALVNISIPRSVTTIGIAAFKSCKTLTDVYCESEIPPLTGEHLFYECTEELKIHVPPGSASAYKTAQWWSQYADNIISDGEEEDHATPKNNELFYTSSVGGIEPYNSNAFNTTIVSNTYSQEMNRGIITFKDDLTVINAEAFKDCADLTSVTFPESLKRIEEYAFSSSGLTSVSLPNNTYSIGDYAFCGCRNLTEVNLGQVIMIGSYAFKDCNLKSVYIPESAERFGHSPFKCSSMMEFTGPTVNGDGKSLHVGNVLIQLADGACKSITSYAIPDGTLAICEGVFQNYRELKSITIPEGLQSIFSYAFDGCSSLTKVILPSSLSVLYNYAFRNCNAIKSIYFNGATAPTSIYNSGEPWDFCNRNTVIRVTKGSINSYTNQLCWDGYNFVEFESGDYSHDDVPEEEEEDELTEDGNVVVLQKATKGNGVDIVIMGDAYSQRQITSGKYSSDLSKAVEHLFNEEPYKSFRDFFNVYQVTVVSEYEGYNSGETALQGFFGDGTLVGGNHEIVAGYASKAIPDSRINETLIIVIMNRNYYAGTCYMFMPATTGDHSPGAAIAYFPLGTDDEMLGQIILHEAGGHGFSKLADEYAYEEYGRISEEEVEINRSLEQFGWYSNVDYTSDPASVKWSHFLSDWHYVYDGLGVYEGGATYWKGVWRPSENSIMRYNTGGFNAPSREAIYKRIHKLAYGGSWQYDYEAFVEYDAINRKSAHSVAAQSYVENRLEPLHEPVIVRKSWREVVGR